MPVYWTYQLNIVFIPDRGDIPKGEDILEQEDLVKLKRCIYSAQVKYLYTVDQKFIFVALKI